MLICFDVDGCLLKEGKSIEANLCLLKILTEKHKVFVWSGNGYEYAYHKVKILKLEKFIHGVLNKYGNFQPDIAFDDQEINLGKLNIKV